MVRGCEFQQDKPRIYLGKKLQRAIISENFVRGATRIVNESKGKIVISNNVGTE